VARRNGPTATTATPSAHRARLAGLELDRFSESEVVEYVIKAFRSGRGGWIATPNIDICRQIRRDPAARALVASAALVVPDGMPLLWAARLSGDPLAERVVGSALIFSLTSASASSGRSIYLLGGEDGVLDLAGAQLSCRYPKPQSGRHGCSGHGVRRDRRGSCDGVRTPAPHNWPSAFVYGRERPDTPSRGLPDSLAGMARQIRG
jgi:UDP-N-acetyl-D-mannosaminuronic acid transferase (WecB/TagA/CpsF family)